ncbi:unnamed protein product [Durusdinium trenchii]|uniref:Phosphodiesterase n=1 Tax=Durusdinium trenchii TaxID=1381693 RepID=A0ABP0I822_9DINO
MLYRSHASHMLRWQAQAWLCRSLSRSRASTSTPATSSTSLPELGGTTSVAPREETTSVAIPGPSKVSDIVFKGALDEDLKGGARHAPVVSRLWSNVPVHVRESFKAPATLDEAPTPSSPLLVDRVLSGVKQLAARSGLAPAHWASDVARPYYGGRIPLAPYQKGQTAAYNYPSILVPREMAHRFPFDMYVDPVFQTSDPTERIKMRGFTLFTRLQNKTTLLLIFSGQPLSGLWTGLQQWLESVGEEFTSLPKTQVFKLHCEEGWFNRRTHQLTKFQLRRQDLALDAWVEQVSRASQKGEASTIAELRKMAKFFSHHSHGPFAACSGSWVGADEFHCERYYQDWGQVNVEPERSASALLVHTETFLVSFDMTKPFKVKAIISLLSNLFTVVVMLFFGVALSQVVTDLAVTPLERMLGTVREIAATVFKFSSLMVGQEEEEGQEGRLEDSAEIDNAGEMILLEKVVEKLAAIASVQAQSERIQRTEDMDKEDLGVLSMLQGTKELRPSNCTSTSEEKQQEIYVRPTPLLNYEANGVDEDTFSSLAFYVYDLSLEQQDKLAVHVMLSHPFGAAVFKGDESAEALAARFVSAVQKAYPENPFHNFGHAVDVQAVIVKTMKLVEADSFLSNLEQFSLLVAGLGHDIGHMGLNNVFLSEVGHELAIKYNDKSPLENMHCSALYQLLGKPETQLFAHLSADDYKEARRICVEVILHTDMMCHQNMVKDLNLLYQIHSEVIQPVRETRTTVRKSNWKRKTMHNEVPSDPMAVFAAPENKMLVMDAIVHSADVSNPAREWAVTQAWAERCLDEFFAQGDQERAEGVPVQFLNDREKLNRPNSQIGFIEFMIAPLFAAQIWLWPMYCEFGDCLSTNIGIWEEQWEEQTSPSEEEAEKVRLRVLEVQDMLSRASLRIAH